MVEFLACEVGKHPIVWIATGNLLHFEQPKAVPPPTLASEIVCLPVRKSDNMYLRANVQDMILILRLERSVFPILPASGNIAG